MRCRVTTGRRATVICTNDARVGTEPIEQIANLMRKMLANESGGQSS
jgi:hypothetical protein